MKAWQIWLLIGSNFVYFVALAAFLAKNQVKRQQKIMALLDDLKVQIHQTTSETASIKLLVSGLKAQLDALASQTTVDPADIAALSAELSADNTDFAALVLANTAKDPVQVAGSGGATSSAAPPVTPFPAPAPVPASFSVSGVVETAPVPRQDTHEGS